MKKYESSGIFVYAHVGETCKPQLESCRLGDPTPIIEKGMWFEIIMRLFSFLLHKITYHAWMVKSRMQRIIMKITPGLPLGA